MIGRPGRFIAPLAVAPLFALPAPAQGGAESVQSAETWTTEEAKAAGWMSAVLDFGSEAISFRTFVPADARVETVKIDREVGRAGPARTKIVGKVARRLPTARSTEP